MGERLHVGRSIICFLVDFIVGRGEYEKRDFHLAVAIWNYIILVIAILMQN